MKALSIRSSTSLLDFRLFTCYFVNVSHCTLTYSLVYSWNFIPLGGASPGYLKVNSGPTEKKLDDMDGIPTRAELKGGSDSTEALLDGRGASSQHSRVVAEADAAEMLDLMDDNDGGYQTPPSEIPMGIPVGPLLPGEKRMHQNGESDHFQYLSSLLRITDLDHL